MGQENQQEQISRDSNVPEDEEGSDQGEVMYEDDVLEEIVDDPSPENGSHVCFDYNYVYPSSCIV